MKGRILGTATIDAAGAITGEDGQRYRYRLADWRGERAATPGVSVDFEIEAGEAKEVYPAVGAGVLGGALGGAPMPSVEQLSSSPVMAKVKSLFTNTLAFPLAVVVLIAFFLPAMSSPVKSVSQWGLGGVLGEAQLGMLDTEGADRRLGQIEEQLARYRQQVARSGRNASDGAYGYGSIGERIDNLEEERAELRQARGKVGFLKAVQAALLLRFAALAGRGLAAVGLLGRAFGVRAFAGGRGGGGGRGRSALPVQIGPDRRGGRRHGRRSHRSGHGRHDQDRRGAVAAGRRRDRPVRRRTGPGPQSAGPGLSRKTAGVLS